MPRLQALAPNFILPRKLAGFLFRKLGALSGRLWPLEPTLEAMAARPYELHLELTNACNANCIFCPYQFQQRRLESMSWVVLRKAVDDFIQSGGGSVGLTPIVGEALVHDDFTAIVRWLRSHQAIDRIWLTTNAILLDKHGVDAVLRSGLTSITVSTAGFDEASYRRIYRSSAYRRMQQNVLDLVQQNRRLGRPVEITIAIRTDRSLAEVMRDVDFQPILAEGPALDFTWSFTTAGGRIKREMLLPSMRLRTVAVGKEPCVQLFNGPIVLPDGTVMACACVAAMDAVADLAIGNVMNEDLVAVFSGQPMTRIREGFKDGPLNPTCAACDMYGNLDLYRTREGRERARVSRARSRGEVVKRGRPKGAFAGG